MEAALAGPKPPDPRLPGEPPPVLDGRHPWSTPVARLPPDGGGRLPLVVSHSPSGRETGALLLPWELAWRVCGTIEPLAIDLADDPERYVEPAPKSESLMLSSVVPVTWQIPESIRKRLGNNVGRQRTMFEEGHLLLVLHAPPKSQHAERQGRFFWRDPQGEWVSKDLGQGIRALARHLEEYEEIIARLDRDEEQATTADNYFQVLENLAPICRAAGHLHHVLQEARKLCPDDIDLINMRDRAYAIERSAELLYGETKNSLDYAVVKRAEEQAQASRHMLVASHRLNMLVAFFFPIATLTAIFGMNLEHGFEQQHSPNLFLGTILVGLLLGLILTTFVARRHRDQSER